MRLPLSQSPARRGHQPGVTHWFTMAAELVQTPQDEVLAPQDCPPPRFRHQPQVPRLPTLARTAHRSQGTICSRPWFVTKDVMTIQTDAWPDEDVHRVRSGRVLSTMLLPQGADCTSLLAGGCSHQPP